MPNNSLIHSDANVSSSAIGKNTRIWKYVTILENAILGENCNVCDFCFIENDVVIGDNVTLKCGVYVWDGIELQDNVFVGPNVTFTNDSLPRSNKVFDLKRTLIKKGASLGANATILGGVTIGEFALIGAGSVVTKMVKPYALIVGNPGKQIGWVSEYGHTLKFKNGVAVCPESSQEYQLVNNDCFLKKS